MGLKLLYFRRMCHLSDRITTVSLKTLLGFAVDFSALVFQELIFTLTNSKFSMTVYNGSWILNFTHEFSLL